MPKRIQRKRTKGWRMPANTVYVGRPSKWGNRFTVEVQGRELAVELYERLVLPDLPVEELRGKDVACWCSLDDRCHGDPLLKAANA